MPTYEYVCTSCGDRLEVVQRFSDDPLTTCPACEGKLRKLFSPVGVVFKGSGFYKTDSRSGKAKTTASAGSSPADSNGGSDKGSTASPAADSSSSSDGAATKSSSSDSSGGSSSSGSSSSGSDSTGGGSKVA
jgi:putative FmdB family regulatory protein